MEIKNDFPNVRRGKFLWMEKSAQKSYIDSLKRKINEGYFQTDNVLSKIAEDLTPVFGDTTYKD